MNLSGDLPFPQLSKGEKVSSGSPFKRLRAADLVATAFLRLWWFSPLLLRKPDPSFPSLLAGGSDFIYSFPPLSMGTFPRASLATFRPFP